MHDQTTLAPVLKTLLFRPYILARRWNWKSALMSSLVRGLIFFAVNIVAGFSAAADAMLTEMAFRAITAGFFGALTQSFRKVQPAWHGAIAVLVLLPFVNHSFEFLVHWARGTEKLYASIGVSVAFTALSSTFHYFVMRRGLLVVGDGGNSLIHDLALMPRAVVAFVAFPFTSLWRATQPRPRPVVEG